MGDGAPPNPRAADRVGEEAVGRFLTVSWGTKAEVLGCTPEVQLRLNPQKVWSGGRMLKLSQRGLIGPRAAGMEAGGGGGASPVPRNAG